MLEIGTNLSFEGILGGDYDRFPGGVAGQLSGSVFFESWTNAHEYKLMLILSLVCHDFVQAQDCLCLAAIL